MIFISHAVKDEPVIESFTSLLQTGANVSMEEIFASSISGLDIPPGNDSIAEVKESIIESDIIILFVTSNYYDSNFCIAELGASWVKNKNVFPLVAPDLDRDIGDNMLGTQTERIDREGLNKLFDELQDTLSERDFNTERWALKRNGFIEDFEAMYEDLPRPEKIDREKLDEAGKRAETAMELQREEERKVRELKQQIEELKDIKDDEEVEEVVKKYIDGDDQYEAHISEVQDILEDMSMVLIRAIYSYYTGSQWSPREQTWNWHREELERGLDSQRIQADGPRDNPDFLSANGDHPEIEEAYHALMDLDSFLTNEASPEFCERLTKKHKIPITLENREFWEKVLLEGRQLPE